MATPVNGQANATSKSKQQRPGKQPQPQQQKAQPGKQQQQQQQQPQPSNSGHPRKNARIDPSDDDHSNTERGRSFYDGSRSARGRSRARSVSRPRFERHRSVGPWQGYASDDGDQDFVRVPRITFEGPGDKRFVRVYDDTMRFDWIMALIRHRCLIDATKPLSLVYSRDVDGELPVELEDEDDFTGLRALAWEGSDVKITVRGTRNSSARWPAPPLLSSADAGQPQQRAEKTPLRRSAPQHSTPTVQISLEPPAKRQKITAIAGDLAASAKKQPATSVPAASTARSDSEEPASDSAPAANTQESQPDTVLESSAPAAASAPERKRGSRGKNKKAPADDADAEVEETVPAVAGHKRKSDENGDVDQADAPPKPKRKRRTKAEMEAARAAEAAANVNGDTVVGAGRQDKSIGEDNEAQSEEVAKKEVKKAKKLAKEARKAGQKDAEAEISNSAPIAEPPNSEAAGDVAPAGVEASATIPNDDSAASKKLLEKGCAICLSFVRHDVEVCPTILAGRAAVKARVEELKAKKQRKIKPERNAQTELVQWLKNHPASSEKKVKKKAVTGDEVTEISSKGNVAPTGESTSEPSEAPMSAENDAGRLLPQSLDADGATIGGGTSASPDRIAARTSPSKGIAGREAPAIPTKGTKSALSGDTATVVEGSGNGKKKAPGGDDLIPTEALPTVQQPNGIAAALSPLAGDEARAEQHSVNVSGQALSHGGGEDSDTSDDSDDDDEAADDDLVTPTSAQHTPGLSERASSPHSETDTQSSSSSDSDSESDRGGPPAVSPQRNGYSSEEEEQDELQATPVQVPEAKGQAVKASSQPAPTPWQRAASLLPFGRSRDSAAFSTSDVVDAPPIQAASQPARKAKPPLLSELSPAHFRKSSFAGSQPNSPLVTPASSTAKAKPPSSQLGSPWTSTNGQSTAKPNGKTGPRSSDGSDDEDSDSDSSDDDGPSTKKAVASVPAARRAGASSSSSLAKKSSNGFFKAFS